MCYFPSLSLPSSLKGTWSVMSTLLGTIYLHFPFFSSRGKLWHHASDSTGRGARWVSGRKSGGRRKGTNEAQKGGQKCDEKAAERTKKCVMNQEKGEEEGEEKHFLIDIDRKPPRATTQVQAAGWCLPNACNWVWLCDGPISFYYGSSDTCEKLLQSADDVFVTKRKTVRGRTKKVTKKWRKAEGTESSVCWPDLYSLDDSHTRSHTQADSCGHRGVKWFYYYCYTTQEADNPLAPLETSSVKVATSVFVCAVSLGNKKTISL